MKVTHLVPMHRRIATSAIVSLTALLAAATTHAAVFVVPEAQLSSPVVNAAGIVNFGEVVNGTAINGLTIKGFTFSENNPAAFVLPATSGPGNTNNVDGSVALQTGGAYNPATYRLTIQMPGLSSSFGFGFAINTFAATANALTITLFDGAVNVGSLVYGGSPDPTFSGGFAGIGSTIAFNSAQVTFGPSAASFAIDNVAAVPAANIIPGPGTAVPEPGSALVGLMVLGLCGARLGRRTHGRAV